MTDADREYVDAWDRLSPEIREAMRRDGVTGPDVDYAMTRNPYFSGPILNDQAVEPTYPVDEPEPKEDRVCETIRRIIGELLCQSNPALALECFSVVTGIGYLGDSMTEIGKRHGVTRAAVSKRCIQYADAFDLDSSRAMRKRRSPKRLSDRRPEVVHPYVNRVVSLFGRLRRSGWLMRQDAAQLRCIREDLGPVRTICDELEALIDQKESF